MKTSCDCLQSPKELNLYCECGLTEKAGSILWVGSPAAGHQVDEGVSAGDHSGQAVQAGVGTHPTQHAEHDLHGVGHL